MKQTKSITLATIAVAALTFINTAAAQTFLSPRFAETRPRTVSTDTHETDYVHHQTKLGNAAQSRAAGPRVIASISRTDVDTLQMVKNCTLAPRLIGDTPACKTCCATKTCCITAMK